MDKAQLEQKLEKLERKLSRVQDEQVAWIEEHGWSNVQFDFTKARPEFTKMLQREEELEAQIDAILVKLVS